MEGAAPQPLVASWDALAPVGWDRVGLAVPREVTKTDEVCRGEHFWVLYGAESGARLPQVRRVVRGARWRCGDVRGLRSHLYE